MFLISNHEEKRKRCICFWIQHTIVPGWVRGDYDLIGGNTDSIGVWLGSGTEAECEKGMLLLLAGKSLDGLENVS